MKILVVEDSLLIAMDLEATLHDAGYDIVGPAATVNEALSALWSTPIDIALLDVNLGGENSFPIAEELSKMKRPFIFLTGFSEGSGFAVPEEFSRNRRIGKPLKYDELLRAIAQELEGTASDRVP